MVERRMPSSSSMMRRTDSIITLNHFFQRADTFIECRDVPGVHFYTSSTCIFVECLCAFLAYI